jgi:hypothetical protein
MSTDSACITGFRMRVACIAVVPGDRGVQQRIKHEVSLLAIYMVAMTTSFGRAALHLMIPVVLFACLHIFLRVLAVEKCLSLAHTAPELPAARH